jgi:hypothetical protein
MALRDWVRNDGYVESYPVPSPPPQRAEEFIMLVRDIQFQDIQTGAYNRFPTLYDVALANKGKNYIPVTDNTKLIQDPPNPNAFRNKNY